MNDQQQMMRQIQQMQAGMAKAQEEIAAAEVTASAGGGMVTVTASGTGEIRAVKIKPEAIDPDDPEMLEDLVVAAVNEAKRAAEKLASEKMASVTGGLAGLAGGLGIPGF